MDLVRFGTHAAIIRANGFPATIPSIGKEPLIKRYPEYGLHPADQIEFDYWVRVYPAASISLVMSGREVILDMDILNEDLIKEILELALKMLGPIDFRRVGRAPKVSLFYRALDDIPTRVGLVIEIFSTAGTKQVLLYGRHPETGGEYEWTGLGSPLTHRFEQMPRVRARQVAAFHDVALKLVADSGYVKPAKPAKDGSAVGPSANVGNIGDMMAEILRAMGNGDPPAVASSYFERTPDGAKHYAMVAAVSALVLRGYSDHQIVVALTDAYQRRVDDDPGLKNLLVCPERVRRGLLRRGAVLPDKPVSNQLTDEQRAAYERDRGIVRGIFHSKLSRRDIEVRAATAIERERDPAVRRALGNVVASHLVRCGWPDATVASALSLATGRKIDRIPGWLGKFRSAAS